MINPIIHSIKLEMEDTGVKDTGIRLKQGDAGIVLYIKPFYNGKIYFDKDLLPNVVFKKPDGSSVIGQCTYDSSGYYIYTILGNELSVPGKLVMDMKFLLDAGRESTHSIIFECVPDTLGDNVEISGIKPDELLDSIKRIERDIVELNETIPAGEKVIEDINDAMDDENVQTVLNAVQRAESAADQATDAKTNARTSEENAGSYASQAQVSASNAETSAVDAKRYSDSAKDSADRAEDAAERAEGIPLAKSEKGNPIKVESGDAQLIDFKVNGYTKEERLFELNFERGGYNVSNGEKTGLYQAARTSEIIDIGEFKNISIRGIDTSKVSLAYVLLYQQGNKIYNKFAHGYVNDTNDGYDFNYIGIFGYAAFYFEIPGAEQSDIDELTQNAYLVVDGVDKKITSLGQTYGCVDLGSLSWSTAGTNQSGKYEMKCDTMKSLFKLPSNDNEVADLHCEKYQAKSANDTYKCNVGISVQSNGTLFVYDDAYNTSSSANDFKASVQGLKLYYPLADNVIPSEYAIRVDEVGKNLWDEEWENGYWRTNVGSVAEKASNATMICNKNLISVKPNEQYYFVNVPSDTLLYFFDADKKLISYGNWATIRNPFTTPNNCKYFAFRSVATTYNNDIAIIEGTSGEYSKYNGQTVFIPTLNPLQDGDSISYHVDGTGTEHRKMGVVDLGTLNWKYDSSDDAFEVSVSAVPNCPTSYEAICDRYNFVGAISATALSDKQMSSGGSGRYVIIKDTSFGTDATAFKSAMSGVMLIYGLDEQTDTALTDNQIAELKKLKTYKSETNISTEELGSMDITFYCDNANAEVVADIQRQVNEKESGSAELPYYSYEEHVVGYWIDGTPIYRKCYDINTSLSTSATNVYASIANISEIKYVIDAKAIRYNTPLIANLMAWKESNTSFKLYAQAPASNVNLLVLEYTKIGDTPRSAQPMLLSDDEVDEE